MKALERYKTTVNACKLCTPLGACLAFKGIEKTIPFLHGSQGCSTYIRRYMISHFKEPIDIASSNFSEQSAVFGGGDNFKKGLNNILSQYDPALIGVASTCLSETIGDDLDMIIKEYKTENKSVKLPYLVHVSTPSYSGMHADGYRAAIKAIVKELVDKRFNLNNTVNVIPGIWSCEDIRHLREILNDFTLPNIIIPDYSETLDGGIWDKYYKIPKGGTKINDIKNMGDSKITLEFTSTVLLENSAGNFLQENFNVPLKNLTKPIGLKNNDKLFSVLSEVSKNSIPDKYLEQRSRLVDAYADGHKHVYGLKAVLYGEIDMVIALAVFLDEIGMIPVICATGESTKNLKSLLKKDLTDFKNKGITVMEDVDFDSIEKKAKKVQADIIFGNSKGYKMSRNLNIPLIRTGFPIHDRIGGARILNIGYHGTLELFDNIVNEIIEKRQDKSSIGYTYM